MVSCEGLGNGGVQAIMMGIVRSLSCECHFDMLLFTSEIRYYDDEFLGYGGNIFRIPHYEGTSILLRKFDVLFRDIYIYHKLNKLLATQEKYDVIHCHNQYESAPILKSAAKYNIPVRICHTHIVSLKGHFILNWMNNIRRYVIEKYATHCIGCSKEACTTFFSKRKRYDVVPNFYDDKKFSYSRLCNDQEKIVLTQVGLLNENKNQLFSIQVLKALIERGEDAILNIIGFEGQDGYKEYLTRQIRICGIGDRVFFYPGDIFIPDVLRSTTTFLMPSKHEGFGIALIEAQAVGVRCIASWAVPRSTNCGDVIYLRIDDDNSPQIWADEIRKVKQTKGLCHNMYNTSRYKLSEVTLQYKKIYDIE